MPEQHRLSKILCVALAKDDGLFRGGGGTVGCLLAEIVKGWGVSAQAIEIPEVFYIACHADPNSSIWL